jgi:hypothetical protein
MDHDQSYKLLFSHAEMVADLLRGFVREDWVQQLDFDSREKVNGSYVADDLREREGDVIWRGRWGRYCRSFFTTLVGAGMRRRRSPISSCRFPAVWKRIARGYSIFCWMKAAMPRANWRRFGISPRRCYAESELATLRNLAAALFRLKNSRTPQDVERILAALVTWLRAPEQSSLRRAFTVWLKRVFLPGRLPGVELGRINDLQEVQSMLAERVTEWTEEWKRQGRLEGEAALLLRQLEQRFGPLNEADRTRVSRADAETLLHWGERVLTAQAIEDVFDL